MTRFVTAAFPARSLPPGRATDAESTTPSPLWYLEVSLVAVQDGLSPVPEDGVAPGGLLETAERELETAPRFVGVMFRPSFRDPELRRLSWLTRLTADFCIIFVLACVL